MSKQTSAEAVAVMLDEAKTILKAAKELADKEGIYYNFNSALQDLYEDVAEEYVDWESSSC